MSRGTSRSGTEPKWGVRRGTARPADASPAHQAAPRRGTGVRLGSFSSAVAAAVAVGRFVKMGERRERTELAAPESGRVEACA